MANKDLPGGRAPKKVPEKATTQGKPRRPSKNDPNGFMCVSCGTRYSKREGAFLTSSSKLFAANDGFMPICTECMEKYYATTLLPALDYNDARAVEMLCALCDWYYSEDALAMAKKALETQGHGVLSTAYNARRRLRQVQIKGDTYIDTIKQRREKSMCINDMDDARGNGLDPDANQTEISPEIIHMFGFGYRPDEYHFLEEQYNDWTSRYDSGTKAMEECMKALCVAQLNIRRSQQRGDIKGAADAIKSFKDLLNTSNLSPKLDAGDQLAETETFGTLIKKWEEDKPIPEPEDEFKDVDGIKKLVSTWFFGHLAKMFNIKNDYSEEYEEEVAKYTVTPPVYDSDIDDADNDIDAIFGNAQHPSNKEEDV